jgi:hypothetical protein
MFSRRVATFLLGFWIGCCLWIDGLALRGLTQAERVINNPPSESVVAIEKAGADNIAMLLRHQAAEQVRMDRTNWGRLQTLLAVAVLIALVFTDQRKGLAIALAVLMLILTTTQQFGVTPELNFSSRQADFLPESAAFSLRSQISTLTQVFAALEIFKLAVGGILASYFFAAETVVKRPRRRRLRTDEELAGESVD